MGVLWESADRAKRQVESGVVELSQDGDDLIRYVLGDEHLESLSSAGLALLKAVQVEKDRRARESDEEDEEE